MPSGGADSVKYDKETHVYTTKCRSIAFGCNKWLRIDLNPVVTLVSAALIWGLVIWCIVQPEKSYNTLVPWMNWITRTWTWLYIGTQDVWFFFIIVVFVSKYGHMKLGKDDEEPEYSDASYFSMLFAAGIGIGLFYFGVSEPVFHYAPGAEYGNRYWDRYSDNQRAQDALNVTLLHWGVHAWIVYVLVGLNLGFVAYRWDLPMTVRTCFYPIIGEHIYGWMGDLVDIVSVVATMFGVCTSLGFGARQLNDGVHRLNSNIAVTTRNQVIIIWIITAVATLSVISGIKLGIRRLSEICFGLGCFIMLTCLFYDQTWYLLNVYVQSFGYYLQYIIQLGFHADAFAMEGNAPDGKQAPDWMRDWTIFYWGWWIAWSPFVGMFIAKISRGRTIRQFITYTLTLPTFYAFFWFSIFGGIGLKMERDAAIAGITCDSILGGKDATESWNGLYRLSCRSTEDRWFDVIQKYEGIGTFLSIVSVISLVLYFVTSSDSGSLVIDCLSANGHPDPPVIQRIFWALTEGATATGLLVAGGSNSLAALQAMSIASGLPYTIILNFMCIALWRSLKVEAGEKDLATEKHFSQGLLDIIHRIKNWPKLLLCVIIPWFYMGRANGRLNNSKPIYTQIILALVFYGVVALCVLEAVHPGLAYIGSSIYFGFATFGSAIRLQLREQYGIDGNMAEDFFAVLLAYPLAAFQMDQHMIDDPRPKSDATELPENGIEMSVPAFTQKVDLSDEMPRQSIHL